MRSTVRRVAALLTLTVGVSVGVASIPNPAAAGPVVETQEVYCSPLPTCPEGGDGHLSITEWLVAMANAAGDDQ